ncbi:TonB-dependent receptor [Mucilaginibacter sp. MD40]|uniref:SusC/RagA family TonB-linked outer membrane protein n=1 Tax=Mucilaginibacter sp. MD40 TaxID=2029590 RepID=UPI00130424E9|nr:TonB-dependent receptor [Mucilaginibacter sp. MD40]
MRLSLIQIILVALTFQVSFSSPLRAQEILERRITIELKNQKLEAALKKIAAKAEVRLVYNSQIWGKTGIISIAFNHSRLKDALDKILSSSELSYEVINDQFIVLKQKPSGKKQTAEINAVPDANPAAPQPSGFVVSGIVTDENNEPLPGVSVKIQDGMQATQTNEKGRYAIGVSAPNSVIEFTFIGYKKYEMKVSSMATLNVKMQPDPGKLDEVVVIGYGTTTRRTSTGSQAGISAKDIQKQPVTNVLQTLQGQLPGVFVTQSNGLPGAGIDIKIRGANSLAKSNLPLFIIDGVPYLSGPINATTSGAVLPSAEGNTSPMNSINPSDIESIEVLKDADATAIYGSRAANGVVLITTKKGKEGKTAVGINFQTGFSKVAHFVDMLNTEQFLNIRRQAFKNDNLTPTVGTAPDLLVWDQNTSNNFQKILMGRTAKSYDGNLNISGGDRNTNFYLSGTYHNEGNVYPGSQGYHRGSAKFSLNHTSNDQRFNLSFSTIYAADKNNISTTDLATYAYNLPPNYPLYKPDGTLYWSSAVNNPLGYLNQTNDNKTSNLLSSLGLKYSLAKGLDIKTTLGYSKTDMEQLAIRPLSSLNPVPLYGTPPTTGIVSSTYNYTNNYIIEPQINYTTTVWKGTLNALAGGTWQFRQSKQPYYITASGFPSDLFLTNISAASDRTVSSASSDYKYASAFGRLTYNVDSKYIANFSFRRDGSSRFGPNNRYGNFGSAAAAWVFSEEKFAKSADKWLSFGKLRGSYGIVGNDDIGNYQYLDSYYASGYSYNGSTGLIPSRIANADFKWESTRKLEFGLDMGFLKDRISMTAAYYRNRTSNQLLSYRISGQAGFTTYQANLPATVQNSGYELNFRTANIKTKAFSWTSSFNISRNRNKLVSFPNIEKSSYYTLYLVGNPINSYYLYQFSGVDPSTGLPAFKDLNGDGRIVYGFAATGRGDRNYAGTAYPDYYGGFNNSFTYKNFNLDFTFQFVKQKGRSLLASSFYPPGFLYNAAANVTNDYFALSSAAKLATTGYGAAYTAYSNYTVSDATVVDASFIRMKNVSLSYSLSSDWLKHISAQSVRLFVQGQNLFTITKYKGFDPESQGVATPPLRTIVAGLQCSF